MIKPGEYNDLTVARLTSVGLFLTDGEGNDVLFPRKYVTEPLADGEMVRVFVYNDSEDRPVATTETPLITLHQFAYLKVVMVNQIGAFVDIGLEKHLLVPFREQPKPLVEGKFYTIFMFLDDQTNRLVGSAKIMHFLNNHKLSVSEGDEVDLLIWEMTDLGYNVIINNQHKGLLYHNEIIRPVSPGEKHKGYIKKIREENKLDVTLIKQGYTKVFPAAKVIIDKLEMCQGYLALTDNSEPEEIASLLGMSKKTFKQTIGLLYKEKKIALEKSGIRLLENKNR